MSFPETIVSGIQPSGSLHLGNYFGAIVRWAEQQHEADCFYAIVDLHAITFPQEPEHLREATLSTAAILLACGIDPERSTLFVQSHVPEHPRLSWVLECMAPDGELRRMPQYREKSSKGQVFGVGLLTYPVLQAADILLYQADAVPVGTGTASATLGSLISLRPPRPGLIDSTASGSPRERGRVQ